MADPVPQPAPAPAPPDLTWLWVAVVVGLVMLRGGGCGGIVGDKPDYVATKPTVLMIEDESPAGRAKLTAEQENILRSLADDGVRKTIVAAGGEVQVLGVKNSVDLDSDWAKAAFAVAEKTDLPSIVAASPRAGVKPQPIGAKTAADIKTLLAPVLAK